MPCTLFPSDLWQVVCPLPLQKLTLDCPNMRSFNHTFDDLTHLKALELRFLEWERLHLPTITLPELRSLTFRPSCILPGAGAMLSGLTNLDRLLLPQVDDQLDDLRHLSRLTFLMLTFRTMPRQPEPTSFLSTLSLLKGLSLTNISEIPEYDSLRSLSYLECAASWEQPMPMIIPALVYAMTNLTSLSLHQVAEVTPAIGQLQQLRELGIAFKAAKVLPKAVWSLPLLTRLRVHNSLTLPEGMWRAGRLRHLTWSAAWGRPSVYLPDDVSRVTGLHSLFLDADEGLLTLPAAIGKLTSLQELRIGCIGLTSLPEEIAQLRRLTLLDFQFCASVKEVPNSLLHMFSLQGFASETEDARVWTRSCIGHEGGHAEVDDA